MKFQILIDSEETALAYGDALLALLSKIEIDVCDLAMNKHIKNVYELLDKLNAKELKVSAKKKYKPR